MPTLVDPINGPGGLIDKTKGSEQLDPSLRAKERFRGIPDSADPLKRDFRLFLIKVWEHLNLPKPTELQLSMAYYLQHGGDRSIIMGFRGVAKSWITAAFSLWVLYCDLNMKVMVVSGSLKRAVAFTNFCLALIREMPLLQHLRPGVAQRQSATAFDVAGCLPDQNPSLNAFGVTGQLAGYRADIIVADDVETATNSLTVTMREKILEAVMEFEAILKPGGCIIYLGTPHAEDSLYVKLLARGYECRIWPARFPTRKQVARYGDRLSGYILHKLRMDPSLAGRPSEPSRFPEEELVKRERGITSAEFMLQYMLDTSLADANRYPLKLRNLIVMPMDLRRGPEYLVWGSGDDLRLPLPSLGFEGDHYHRPAEVSEHSEEYQEVVAHIDPSGGGLDETTWTIGALLNGMVHSMHSGGSTDGHSPATLRKIAKDFVRFNVQRATIETNFGDGMFLQLFQPYVIEEWEEHNAKARQHNRTRSKGQPAIPDQGGTALEEVRAVQVSKEERILSVLEPVTAQHRLVVNEEMVQKDYDSIKQEQDVAIRHRYSLFYQFTHLANEKDSLGHDDRIDGLAGMVAMFAEALGVSPRGYAKQKRDEEQDELERLLAQGESVEFGIPNTLPKPRTRMKAAEIHKR